MGARNSNSAKKQSLEADDPTCNMDNNCNNSNKGENESPIGGGSGYQRAIWPALGKKIGNDLNDPRSLEEQLKQPIQEIINKQIVDTARESDDMVKEYAKNLIIETLNDKESGGKLGIVLQNVFSYEPVLKTTRGLAHWAVQSDPSFSTALYNSKWSIDHWADTYGVKVISRYSVDYLDSMYAQHIVIKPILLWVLKQEDFFIQPMAVNVVHSIPWGKESCTWGLKYAAVETLKSDAYKKYAKDMILYSLKSTGATSSTVVSDIAATNTTNTVSSTATVGEDRSRK